MERRGFSIFVLFYYFSFVYSQNDVENDLMTTSKDFLQPENLVLWPNGTIPFYIDTDHFDNEQTLAIMSSLSLLAFRTCLRFSPAMVAPSEKDHVLVLTNPTGARKCAVHTDTEPNVVNLGYDCLKAPWLDRFLLRALGLPFEHNRANREDHIDVQYENIEQHAIPLFTKDFTMPAAIRALPYDIHSVLHFGDRDFSKNGHRTIIFKDRELKQKREGMTDLDIRKVEIIYGPECQKRDRWEKIELCHLYPGIPMNRRKRSVDIETTRSLRVNPDITPPPEIEKIGLNISDELLQNIRSLDIDDEVQNILDDVHRLTVKALKNARIKYCNKTDDLRRSGERTDLLGIIKVVADYAQSMVDHAVNNLTSFCEESESIEKYQRYNCAGCYKSYHSTSQGVPYHSTKHRPYIPQSTWHQGGLVGNKQRHYELRAGDDNETVVTDETTPSIAARKRRQLDDTTPDVLKENEHYIASTTAITRLKREAYDEPKSRRRSEPVSEASDDSGEVYVSDDGGDSAGEEKKGEAHTRWPTTRQDVQENLNQQFVPDNGGELKKKRKGRQRKRPGVKQGPGKDTKGYGRDEEREESGGRIYDDMREDKRHRKQPMNDVTKKDKFKKDTIEVYSDHSSELIIEEREPKIQREKPTIEDRDEARSGEREPKIQREKPTIEDRDEARSGEREPKIQREKPTIEDRDEARSGEREGKMQTQVSEDSKEKTQENSDVYKDETESGESDTKSEKQRPASKDKPEPQQEEPDDDDDDNDEYDSNVALRTVEMSKANKEFYSQRKWPGGKVPYYIDRLCVPFDVSNLRYRLEKVAKILRKRTCVRIFEIMERDMNKYDDYLVLDNSPDYITGRTGRRQNFGCVELLKGGQHRQHAAMMVMAMLGFYFELARHDRDEYVKVHTRHIRPDKLHHFEKLGDDATLPLPFDYQSATMPAWMYWRKVGKKGISTVATYKDKDPDGKIMRSFGQNTKLLSDGDIIKINSLYGTKCLKKDDKKSTTEEPEEGGRW